MLDTGPLGLLVHPRPQQGILGWHGQLVIAGVQVIIPEIADYELRRELIRLGSLRSLRRLERLEDPPLNRCFRLTFLECPPRHCEFVPGSDSKGEGISLTEDDVVVVANEVRSSVEP